MTYQFHTSCFKNISEAWNQQAFVIAKDKAFHLYQGWLLLPVTIIGFVSTLVFILAAIKEHRVSRKFYALLLNRAFGDLMACIVSAISVSYILLTPDHVSNNLTQILSTIFIGSFWSAMVTYVSIGFLKLYGIARPLHYRQRVTVRRTVHLIVLSWIAFFILFCMTMSVTALVKIDFLSDLSGCKVETCLTVMYKIRNTMTWIVYFITIGCFLITVVLIQRARRHAKSLHSDSKKEEIRTIQKRFRYPLIKLALNVGSLAVFHFPYTVFTIMYLFADGCFYIQHYDLMTKLQGFFRFSLLLRMIFDAFISFSTDKEIQKSILQTFGFKSKQIAPVSNSGRKSEITSVGEISTISEANINVVQGTQMELVSNDGTESEILQDPYKNGSSNGKMKFY